MKILKILWYIVGFWTGFSLLDQFVFNPSIYQDKYYLPGTIAFAIIFATFVLWFLLGRLKKKISA